MGVGVGVVVLLAAGLIIISGTVCLRRRSKKPLNTTGRHTYQLPRPPRPDHTPNTSRGGVVISSNAAYGLTMGEGLTQNEAYVEQSGNVTASANGGEAGVEHEYDDIAEYHYYSYPVTNIL